MPLMRALAAVAVILGTATGSLAAGSHLQVQFRQGGASGGGPFGERPFDGGEGPWTSGLPNYGGYYYPRSDLEIARPPRGYGPGPSAEHSAWCESRYRSYRASDNSFQPYEGPRRPCVSPYR